MDKLKGFASKAKEKGSAVAAAAIAAKLLQGGDAWDLRGGLGPQLQAFLGSLGG